MDSSEVQRVRRLLESKRQLYNDPNSQPESAEETRDLLEKVYGEWMASDGYDKDMVVLGFIGFQLNADLLCSYVTDKSSRLLDGACGSGLVGQELKRRGYQSIDALDASKTALDSCRKKGVHDNYWCEVLGSNRLPIQDDTYDGVSLSACIGTGHVLLDSFHEVIRITKPGGYIVFDVREYLFESGNLYGGGKLDAFLHDMATQGRWEYVLKKRSVYMKPKGNEGTEHVYLIVVRVI